MKDIGFRAWIESEKKMMVVTSLEWSVKFARKDAEFNRAKCAYIYDSDGRWVADWYKSGEFILLRKTNITDKNGKEIYEGDIVRVSDSEIATFHEVKYYADESYPAFDLAPAFDLDCNSFSSVANSPEFDIEVVGNIYENPELMEK